MRGEAEAPVPGGEQGSLVYLPWQQQDYLTPGPWGFGMGDEGVPWMKLIWLLGPLLAIGIAAYGLALALAPPETWLGRRGPEYLGGALFIEAMMVIGFVAWLYVFYWDDLLRVLYGRRGRART